MHQTNDFVGFKNRRFFIKTQCHESKKPLALPSAGGAEGGAGRGGKGS